MKNLKDYPSNWKAISARIRFDRAKGRCEHCGMVHGGLFWNGRRFVKIVLTTAHVGADKPDGTPGSKADLHDVRDENLLALCQFCHLAFDRSQHQQTKARNKRLALERANQSTFNFED